jgi:hypothetical protein
MGLGSLAQTVMHTGIVSHTPGEMWVAPISNTETPIPNFNLPVIDPDKEVFNTSRNILDDEEPKFYRQAISGRNADLLHSAIEAEIDTLRRNHSWEIVDRPCDRKIVDSQLVFNIKRLSERSVDKFKPRLVAKRYFQIHEQDYSTIFAPVVHFDSVCLLLSIVAVNGFVPQQLDVIHAFLYGELKETIYI